MEVTQCCSLLNKDSGRKFYLYTFTLIYKFQIFKFNKSHTTFNYGSGFTILQSISLINVKAVSFLNKIAEFLKSVLHVSHDFFARNLKLFPMKVGKQLFTTKNVKGSDCKTTLNQN